MEDFFPLRIVLIFVIGLLWLGFFFVCDPCYQTDSGADQGSDRRAVLLSFDSFAALLRIFGIIINDPGYRSCETADCAGNTTYACRRIAVGDPLRFLFCKGAFAQMLLVKLTRILPACRLTCSELLSENALCMSSFSILFFRYFSS